MEIDSENIIGKYEERFIRRLGEIAILLHLAKSPEGSHAYEMRSKASEIIFERRKKGADFLQLRLEILSELGEFLSKPKKEISFYNQQRKEIIDKLDQYPIFKHNSKIQKFISEDYQITPSDIEYIDEMKNALAESIKETRDQAVIWSNISGIYPAIETLEKSGLIKLDREDPEGGRLKRIFTITELGKESLFRVMSFLLDMSSFIMETEGRQCFTAGRNIFSSRLVPFKKLLEKLTEDLTPDFKKKMLSFKGKPHGKPFVHMMMTQGLAPPRLHALIRHPEMMKEHLESLESEEERKMTKSFLKTRLLEQKNMINKLLEEL
ncbi:MAG: PadR family transcriptional regulator [Candidatus Heimdallarchaeota archaeon]|nr:PadR family transcriptional regulator [Candidatus Heimdallarchaeota archaeon]